MATIPDSPSQVKFPNPQGFTACLLLGMPLVFCQVIQAKAVFIHYLEVDKALQRQRLAKKYNTMALQCDAQTWISWNRVEYTHNEADKPNMWHGIRIALLSSKLFSYQEIPAENHR